MRYSRATRGFYSEARKYLNLPSDLIDLTDDEYQTLRTAAELGKEIGIDSSGRPVLVDPMPPVLTVEQRVSALLIRVDAWLNAAARAEGYDSIITAALRAGYPGPYHDQGVAFATWMDTTYARCYELLAKFKAGELAEPSAAELIAMLPPLKLPA